MPYSYTCQYCGKNFNSPKKYRKFCCKECSDLSRTVGSNIFTCAYCGKEFYDQKHERKYCSTKCSSEAVSLGTISANCPVCGKEFVTTGRKPRKACSKECVSRLISIGQNKKKVFSGGKRSSEKVTIHCDYCGKDIIKLKSRLKKTNFCCQECHYKFNHKKRIKLTCNNCGEEYECLEPYVNLRGSKYCSKKCMMEVRSKEAVGENNPNWKGGRYIGDYGPNWNRQRRKARQRDNYTCQICGATKDTCKNIDVHHIIPFLSFNGDWKEANKLSNLVCLCRSCHPKVENGTICIKPQ